ncbi:MAG: iron uptake porin, partial [Pseudanabaena sp.]
MVYKNTVTNPLVAASVLLAVFNIGHANAVELKSSSTSQNASSAANILQKIENDTLVETPTLESDKSAQNVTSVSQLTDVKPTDWAFTALQSLVERYGCIAGYPDRTFRGKQATSRYEFAAGLNACLDKVNEIIAAGLADKVSKDDLAAIKKLQEECAAELATLRGRVDALDAKVTKLEAQQFSTTTKLNATVIFALADTFGGVGTGTNAQNPQRTT